jgi:hypothetical protein
VPERFKLRMVFLATIPGLRTRVEAPRRFLFCSVRIQANLTSGRAADEWGRSWYGSLRETGFSPL